MAWSDELDGQAQQQWHSRVAQKRLDLSASVEETLLQPAQATEEIAAPVTPVSDGSTNPGLPAVDETKKSAETGVAEPRVEMSGSATFESGQSEVAVANVHVTVSSVVVVMLAGDPGPVVVQYVSLQPRTGFTVHLSAPAKNKTPFNYRIL